MKIYKISFLLLSFILLIPAHGYARYQSSPLKKSSQQIDFAAQEFIAFDCKALHAKDCKKYFNTKSIIKKGYQPVCMTFVNNSKHSIAIALESFSFECATAEQIAYCLHRDGCARGLGFGLGALFFSPILIIPALVQGLGAVAYNEQMDIDFAHKALKNQIVRPYTIVQGVVFADSSEWNQGNFTFTVKNIEDKAIFTLSSQKQKLVL